MKLEIRTTIRMQCGCNVGYCFEGEYEGETFANGIADVGRNLLSIAMDTAEENEGICPDCAYALKKLRSENRLV